MTISVQQLVFSKAGDNGDDEDDDDDDVVDDDVKT